MLLCVPLLLLMGLSACTGTAAEDLAVGAEAGSWITLTLEDGGIPGIQLQLQLQEEYLLSSQREEQLHHQGTSKGERSRASWAGWGHLRKAERMRTRGQSESPHHTLCRGLNPAPALDVTAASQPHQPLLHVSPVPDNGVSHPASLNSLRFLPCPQS
ncbi:tachykinin-4 isoform X1 [Vulpes vulpes]|uniref:Tachykinin-4 isoform X1 n=1 Tax=Vulpes vulpes TaxID=9627 RepID=A0A3Q7S0N7_VULVU|nr:tachykinin-4 isoform X1 [Vulpes vulpes]